MAVAGSVIWNLDAESKGFDSKIKKASKDAKDFGKELDSIKIDGILNKAGDAIGKVGSAILDIGKKATIALGAASVAAAGFSIKSAASFEQTRIGLENMLGTADGARTLLKDISKFAAETPFEFPELAQATRQLVAFGFTGNEAFDTMKQLGNVSAAVGAPINDLAYLMGTLRAQGRAFTIDIRQFAQRGIPIYEYLGKVLNKNTQEITAMIEAGQIGFPEVQKAFQALAGEGGKWGNTMARQSKSLSGLFSTLKDVLGQTGRELIGITQEGDIKEGSVFAKLRDAVDGLTRNLPVLIEQMKEIIRDIVPKLQQWADNIINVARQVADYLQPKLEALWQTLQKDLIPALTKFWKDVLLPMVPVIGTTLVLALGLAIDAFNLLLAAVSPVINFLAENEQIFWGVVAVLGAIRVALFLQGALAAFQAVMAGVVASYGTMAALIASPLALPAIVVVAALASLTLVLNAIQSIMDAIDAMNNAAKAAENEQRSSAAARNKVLELEKAGSQDQRLRASETLRRQGVTGYASGTSFAPGGMSLVGEQGPEIVNLPRGSEVIPNHEIGGSEIHIGTINISSEVDGRKWLRKLGRDQEIASNGLIPSSGAY